MKMARFLILTALTGITLSWFSVRDRIPVAGTRTIKISSPTPSKTAGNLRRKAEAARSFTKKKGLNEKTCFLIDMSLPSGQNRFFIYDLKNDSVTAASLVAHGNCFEYWLEGRKYSNEVGSGCTSLGRYKIGTPYTGKFGYSYKLHGLDSSNNNAYERTVVLHAHACVPDSETSEEICQSNGCPTVSPSFLQRLKSLLNHTDKPVLLWIFDEASF